MVSVIDQIEDGLSAVYTFFDPEREKASLGTYGVLWQIDLARRLELPYVYLGYWIGATHKMAYKTQYQPLEGLINGHWRPLRDV
jgi:arginyl-tRNA--protein-N-Asp/Glu arginylyltransferase